MKMSDGDDFTVETDGRCFICFKSTSGSGGLTDHPSIQSLQCLSRYLKMELSSVFNEKGSIPPYLLAKVEKARLKVELCGRCSGLNETFTKLYRKWEKIEMEVGSCVNLIHRTFLEAEETASLVDVDGGKNGKLEIVQVLRDEAIKKCWDKLSSVLPRVKIKRLTTGKRINAVKSPNVPRNVKTHVPQAAMAIEELPYPVELNGLKLESKTSDDEDDFNNYNHFEESEMYGPELEQSMNEVISNLVIKKEREDEDLTEKILPNADNDGEMSEIRRHEIKDGVNNIPGKVAESTMFQELDSRSRYSHNPETGKYKCSLCSKKFTQSGFSNHYKNVHLKVRYKCTLCTREFILKSSLKDHYDNVHLHIRVKCNNCEKTFSSKTGYRLHKRKCRLSS